MKKAEIYRRIILCVIEYTKMASAVKLEVLQHLFYRLEVEKIVELSEEQQSGEEKEACIRHEAI